MTTDIEIPRALAILDDAEGQPQERRDWAILTLHRRRHAEFRDTYAEALTVYASGVGTPQDQTALFSWLALNTASTDELGQARLRALYADRRRLAEQLLGGGV